MSNTAELRAALEAALPDLTAGQARAARALIDALTPPAMDEPQWPGAPVIAQCFPSTKPRLHVRRGFRSSSRWECGLSCLHTPWDQLINPRPLTPAEYAKHGIPAPCTHGADEETTRRAEGTTP